MKPEWTLLGCWSSSLKSRWVTTCFEKCMFALKMEKKGDRHVGRKQDFTLKGTYQPCLVSGRRSRVLRSRWDTCKKNIYCCDANKTFTGLWAIGSARWFIAYPGNFFFFFFLSSFFFFFTVVALGESAESSNFHWPLIESAHKKKFLWWIEDGGHFLPCPLLSSVILTSPHQAHQPWTCLKCSSIDRKSVV